MTAHCTPPFVKSDGVLHKYRFQERYWSFWVAWASSSLPVLILEHPRANKFAHATRARIGRTTFSETALDSKGWFARSAAPASFGARYQR